jgi:RNA polymerase sigma-70 factor (ECF subfamily)
MKRPRVNPLDEASGSTASELLRGARLNDQQAWQQIVTLYSRRMYRWCRQAGLQPADASNVVQEAFAAVARKIGDFRKDRPGDTFRGWLRRIIDNKIRDHFRRQGRTVDLALGGTDAQWHLNNVPADEPSGTSAVRAAVRGPAIDPSEPTWDTRYGWHTLAGQSDLRDAVRRVQSQVSPRDWQVFWRVAVDGQSAGEAGAEFGMTANAVRLVKMRILRRLRATTSSDAPSPDAHHASRTPPPPPS